MALSTPALSAHASPWGEIEPHLQIHLKKDLTVTPDFKIPAGQNFIVDDVEAYGDPAFESITLNSVQCPEDQASRSLALTLLEDRYGFELETGCKYSFYLELKDFDQESYFELNRP